MTINKVLLDSSFMVSMYDRTSKYHDLALDFSKRTKGIVLVPTVALTQVTYLMQRDGGISAVLRFLDGFSFPLETTPVSDLRRVREIMAKYASARFDFVDCCIMALAERLNITQVCTFDRRDFSIFRPRHCTTLTLLP